MDDKFKQLERRLNEQDERITQNELILKSIQDALENLSEELGKVGGIYRKFAKDHNGNNKTGGVNGN